MSVANPNLLQLDVSFCAAGAGTRSRRRASQPKAGIAARSAARAGSANPTAAPHYSSSILRSTSCIQGVVPQREQGKTKKEPSAPFLMQKQRGSSGDVFFYGLHREANAALAVDFQDLDLDGVAFGELVAYVFDALI